MNKNLFLTTFILLLTATVANAQAEKIGDLWYVFTTDEMGSKIAMVTSPDNDENYSGEIFIPEEIYRADDTLNSNPYTVTVIGNSAFSNCDGLTVHIPKTIGRIVPNAFDGCTNLTIDVFSLARWCRMKFNTYSSVMQESMFGIRGSIFKNVDHFLIDGEEVIDLVIPEEVTTINRMVFSGYSGLQSVVIESNPTTFGDSVFANCKNLKTVSVTNNELSNIGYATFYNCPNLETVSIADNKLESLPQSIFGKCSSLSSVTLPSSLTSFDFGAFSGCTSLTDFTFPENLLSVGDSAFKDCSSLTDIDLSANPKIGNYAFYGCANLDIKLPAEYSWIGDYAFCGNQKLKTLDITVKDRLGSYAFANCTGLTQVSVLCENSFGFAVFKNCTSLQSATIKEGSKELPGETFGNCTALTHVNIPEGIKYIGCAFWGCSGLKEITIPESVTTLYDSPYIDSLKVHVKSVDFWIGMNTNTFSLKGGRELLVDNQLVREVEFPVGSQKTAFKGYEYLEKITLPDGNYDIRDDAFNGCDQLACIYCYAETPPHLSNYAFSDKCIQMATVYVPGHLVETYRQNQPDPHYPYEQRLSWSVFRIEPIPGTDEKCAAPTVTYENGKLSFSSDTEGASFVSLITCSDMGRRESDEIELTATYHISVYATAKNHAQSDLVEAVLCWIDADPQINIKDDVTEVSATPVIVEQNTGMLTVRGLRDGENVTVYNLSGQNLGSAVSSSGTASVRVGSQQGCLLVKIGKQTVKIKI